MGSPMLRLINLLLIVFLMSSLIGGCQFVKNLHLPVADVGRLITDDLLAEYPPAISKISQDVIPPESLESPQKYIIPISVAKNEPYSTFGVRLVSDRGLVDQFHYELEESDSGVNVILHFLKPLVKPEKVVLILSYLGNNKRKTVVLPVVSDASDVDLNSRVKVRPAREDEDVVLFDYKSLNLEGSVERDNVKCFDGSLIVGRLLANVKRILSDCDYEMGKWPESLDKSSYVDFVIKDDVVLGDGYLSELFDFLLVNFSILGTKNKSLGNVDFERI